MFTARHWVCLLAVLLAAADAPAKRKGNLRHNKAANKPAKKATNKPAIGNMPEKMLAAHNAQRQKRGLKPLTLSAKLTKAAQDYAELLVKHHKFGHAENGGLGRRAVRAGYLWTVIGENLAAGQRTPEQAVKAWMKSPGHRANILGKKYLNAGFGHAGNIWVADYGRPRSPAGRGRPRKNK